MFTTAALGTRVTPPPFVDPLVDGLVAAAYAPVPTPVAGSPLGVGLLLWEWTGTAWS